MSVRSLVPSRRASVFWLAAVAAGLTFGATAQTAAAGTSISSDITSDTTWTAAGSPYILDASEIHVAAGVTLTIEPGVTVEFNVGGLSQFVVAGTLSAVGTADNHITFTSAQGALGGGAPGQYGGVLVWSGNAQSQFSYVDFSYGGYGSGGYYAYGVLEVGNGSSVSIDHSTFEHNEYAGLHLGDGDAVNVSYSTFADNGDGISVTGVHPGPLDLSASRIDDNVQDGLFFNFGNNTVASVLTGNEITGNDGNGIAIEPWDCSAPAAWPHGEGNSIYDNGDPASLYPADGGQLYVGGWPPCRALSVDWNNNYWGDAELIVGPDALPSMSCDDTQPSVVYETGSQQPSGYLAYRSHDPAQIPPGPVSTAAADTFFSCANGFGMWTLADVTNAIDIQNFQSTPFTIP